MNSLMSYGSDDNSDDSGDERSSVNMHQNYISFGVVFSTLFGVTPTLSLNPFFSRQIISKNGAHTNNELMLH